MVIERVGFISDLHTDVNMKFAVTTMLIQLCDELKLDYLIIAGDISNNYETTINFLNIFKENSKTVIRFIAGNHDIFVSKSTNINEMFEMFLNSMSNSGDITDSITDNRMSSDEIYKLLCKREECLVYNPLILGEYAVIGETCHYDYSFKIDNFSIEEQARKQYRGNMWADLKYLKWNDYTDQELNDFFLNRLRIQLELYKDKKVICCTHTVPFKEFIKYKNNLEHDYFSGFIGSSEIGQLLLSYPNVEMSVFGHTHYRKEMQIGHIQASCAPLGYYYEWETPGNTYLELKNVIKVIDIDISNEAVR